MRGWLRARRADRRHAAFLTDYQLTVWLTNLQEAQAPDSERIVPLIRAREKVTQ